MAITSAPIDSKDKRGSGLVDICMKPFRQKNRHIIHDTNRPIGFRKDAKNVTDTQS